MRTMWKLIFKILGAVIAVTTVTGIIWKTAVYFNDVEHRENGMENQLEFIINTQAKQGVINDSILLILGDVKSDVKDLKRGQDALTNASNNLREYMKEHASSTDELLEVLEIWEAKKNNGRIASNINQK